MAYNIKDPRIDQLISELALVKGKPILDSIPEACGSELQREQRKSTVLDRLQPHVLRLAAAPMTRKKVNKDFFDELSGDAP